MINTTVCVFPETPEVSEKIQLAAFAKGYGWECDGTEVWGTDKPMLIMKSSTMKITWADSLDDAGMSAGTELAATAEVMEWLKG